MTPIKGFNNSKSTCSLCLNLIKIPKKNWDTFNFETIGFGDTFGGERFRWEPGVIQNDGFQYVHCRCKTQEDAEMMLSEYLDGAKDAIVLYILKDGQPYKVWRVVYEEEDC